MCVSRVRRVRFERPAVPGTARITLCPLHVNTRGGVISERKEGPEVHESGWHTCQLGSCYMGRGTRSQVEGGVRRHRWQSLNSTAERCMQEQLPSARKVTRAGPALLCGTGCRSRSLRRSSAESARPRRISVIVMSAGPDVIRGRYVELDKANATRGTVAGNWAVIAHAKRSTEGGNFDTCTVEVYDDETAASTRALRLPRAIDEDETPPAAGVDGFVKVFFNMKRSELHNIVTDWKALCGTFASPRPANQTPDPIAGRYIECDLLVEDSAGDWSCAQVTAHVALVDQPLRYVLTGTHDGVDFEKKLLSAGPTGDALRSCKVVPGPGGIPIAAAVPPLPDRRLRWHCSL